MKPAVLSSRVEIPLENLQPGELERITRQLTVTPKDFGMYGKPPPPIVGCEVIGSILLVPVSWGVEYCLSKKIPIIQRLENGLPITLPRLPDPYHPKAPANQKAFFDNVVNAFHTRCVLLACSPTGTGKTATGLNLIGQVGRAGLVIVHSKEIARQWREVEIPKHLGLTADDVGIVEGNVCTYLNKPIVVAVIHNIIQKKFPPNFYSHFGVVIWDEGHKLGAPGFNQSTHYFSARYRLVLTATPNRKDGCMRLITNFFGQVGVSSESKPMDGIVQAISYQVKKKYPPAMPRARLINLVTSLPDRNQMMADVIFAMYKAGRNFIGLSDRISQLQDILELLHGMGVPEAHLALYTRSYVDGDGKNRTTTAAELEEYRANAKVFLATYHMAKEGLDIPRLDAGMCLSPATDGVQAVGRILRPFDNKPTPIWYVIKDFGNTILIRSYIAFVNSVRALPHIKFNGEA